MTDPVRVVATLKAKSGKGPELLAAWPELAAKVRAEEGCLAYDLHAVLGDDDGFVVLERWASMEALKAHGASDHMKEFGTLAASLLEGRAGISFLQDTPSA